MKPDTRCVFAVVATVLVLAAVPQTVVAEHHEDAAPQYTMIHYDDVGPANAPAYEENAKDWVAAFKEAGMGEEWGWQTYSGPNFSYAFLTDVPNYAYMDMQAEREKVMVEAIGAEKIAELSAGGGGSSRHRHELTKDMPEFNYTPEGGIGESGLVHLSTHYVKPGMAEQFKALMAKVTEARKKVGGGLAVRVFEVQFGNGSYQVATLAKDAATFYSATSVGKVLGEVYGPEEAKAMFDQWRECITDYKTADWRFEPELSYMPGMDDDDKEMMDDKEGMGEEE